MGRTNHVCGGYNLEVSGGRSRLLVTERLCISTLTSRVPGDAALQSAISARMAIVAILFNVPQQGSKECRIVAMGVPARSAGRALNPSLSQRPLRLPEQSGPARDLAAR